MGLRGGCCGSSRGLEVDAAASYGAWRWTLWLPVGLGGRCHGCPWCLEVNTAGARRWTLQLLVGFGGGQHGSLRGLEVDAAAPQHWCVMLAWGQGSGRRRRRRRSAGRAA